MNETRRSVRFFRALLRVLPVELREAHGREMEQAFHAERAEATRARGRAGAREVWLAAAAGILRTAPRAMKVDPIVALRT